MSITQVRLLLGLGVAAFLVLAVTTLPASVVVRWFAPEGVHFDGVSGTIWDGRAQVLRWNETQLGRVEWDLHALPLLAARLSADMSLTRIDGFARTRLSVMPARRLRFTDLTASLPLSVLPANILAGGWAGTLNLKFAQLALHEGWPVAASGHVEVLQIRGPARSPRDLGSFEIIFPQDEPDAAGSSLTGALADLGGPLDVTGSLQLLADRSYVVEGLIATRADAPADIGQMLQFLGPADQQGRHPFSIAGSL